MGREMPGPISEALKWLNPLSSPQVAECLDRSVLEAIFSRRSFMSCTSAGSNSMVVIEAVEPVTETHTIPSRMPESPTTAWTSLVMSMMSE